MKHSMQNILAHDVLRQHDDLGCNKVKTYRRDSRKIAHLFECGIFKKVYVLSEKDRADRKLVRTMNDVFSRFKD